MSIVGRCAICVASRCIQHFNRVCRYAYALLFISAHWHSVQFSSFMNCHTLFVCCSSCQWSVCACVRMYVMNLNNTNRINTIHIESILKMLHMQTHRDYYCCCFLLSVPISHCSSHIIIIIYRICRHSANFRECSQPLKIECDCVWCTLSFFLSKKNKKKKKKFCCSTLSLSKRKIHCINGSLICRVHFFSFPFSILYRYSHQSVANHGQISTGFIWIV